MAKKWDCDATSSEKLLWLFTLLLFNKRPYSLKELSACLNASKATVLRLLRQLEHCGIGMLIHEKRGRESWYSLEHGGHNLPKASAQAEFAPLCQDWWPAGNGGEDARPARIFKGRINYLPFQGVFKALEQAISKKLICRVSYLALVNMEAREHLFAPMRTLYSHDTIYIEGWLLDQASPAIQKFEDPLRFALQRIRSCEVLEDTSAALPQLPPVRNRMLGLVESGPFRAKIRFAPEAARYVAERTWSASQKLERLADGAAILEVEMANPPEALAWILGFGKAATALEPEWFARLVRRELREAARNYRMGKAGDRDAREQPGGTGEA